jgi:putative oxidoreductase
LLHSGRFWRLLVEWLGGFAVVLSAYLWAVAIPMAVVLLVAMFTVHLAYGFSSIKLVAVTAVGAQFGSPGYETILLYLACLAALVLSGAGPLSIDSLRANRRDVHTRVGALESAAKCTLEKRLVMGFAMTRKAERRHE